MRHEVSSYRYNSPVTSQPVLFIRNIILKIPQWDVLLDILHANNVCGGRGGERKKGRKKRKQKQKQKLTPQEL
jgi:hypothetical protein